MRTRMRASPAPSMRAASISSSGTPWMNWRIRKMPKALTRLGAITPISRPSKPIWVTMRYSGISVTIGGRNIVAMSTANSALRPRKRYLAKA